METNIENKDSQHHEEMWKKWEQEHKRGKIMGGVLLVIIGSLFLIRELGIEIPQWVFTWKTLLVGMGLLLGIKSGFRNSIWFIFILVGGAFLVSDLYPELVIKQLLWPILVILLGIFIIFKPRRKSRHHWEKWHRYQHKQRYKHMYKHGHRHEHPPFNFESPDAETTTTKEGSIDFVSFMSGIKKNVVTKNFKGGEITVVFAGARVNLSQADFNDTATLEVTQVFGGTQLIIPADWEIKSEVVCMFGNVEDKRDIKPTTNNPGKVLILRGTIFMGGLEIKSF